MNKEELRIGNLVNIKSETSDFDYIHYIVELTSTEALVKCNEESDWFNYDNIEGITLSEDWLLKAGFEKEAPGTYKRGNCIYWIDYSSSFNFGTLQIASGYAPLINAPCQYVHQIQNLIFVLTGTELQFK